MPLQKENKGVTIFHRFLLRRVSSGISEKTFRGCKDQNFLECMSPTESKFSAVWELKQNQRKKTKTGEEVQRKQFETETPGDHFTWHVFFICSHIYDDMYGK